MPLPTSDAEILSEHARATLESVHVAQPGFVVTYYPATCTADVRPALKRPLLDEFGAVAVYEQLPVIPGVPVCFPRGGGFHMTFPLVPGDSVLLVISEQALGEWHDSGDVSEPADVRRHGLSGAFCVPGGFPSSKPPADAGVAANALVVGRDGHDEQIQIPSAGGTIKIGATATDFAALASLVMARLNRLQAAFDAHTHLTAGTGSPVPPTAVPGVIPVGTLADVAASKTKVL